MRHTLNKVARYLILSDGTVHRGEPLGADGDAFGEAVFNTGMTGYQEILTDPSYAGQIVTLTYPLVGNYGINAEDFESDVLQPAGFVVRESCDAPSNWRSRATLHDLLVERGLVAIQGVDTRAIAKRLRSAGVSMAMITDREPESAILMLASQTSYGEQNFVERVSTMAPYAWGYEGREAVDEPAGDYKHRVVVIDCGLKFNILRRLAALGCRSIVLPSRVSADEVLGWNPDGVMLSPGPGDPAGLVGVATTVRGLVGKTTVFGICLGNQMLAHALGAKTKKLKFGHRGSNHPVKDLVSGRTTITSQNHGYAVDEESLPGTGLEVTQVNLNDGTIEGLMHENLGAMSIQYHPEAAPGPWDSRPYFEEFVNRIERAGA